MSKDGTVIVLLMCSVSDCLLSIYESSPESLPHRQKPVDLPLPLATGQTLSTAEYSLTDMPAYIEYVPNSILFYIYIRQTLVEHGRVDSVNIITYGTMI